MKGLSFLDLDAGGQAVVGLGVKNHPARRSKSRATMTSDKVLRRRGLLAFLISALCKGSATPFPKYRAHVRLAIARENQPFCG